MTTQEQEYYNTLSKAERTCVDIAKRILKSSFDLSKSIGFQEWKKSNN
jgi:hypothetical protein